MKMKDRLVNATIRAVSRAAENRLQHGTAAAEVTRDRNQKAASAEKKTAKILGSRNQPVGRIAHNCARRGPMTGSDVTRLFIVGERRLRGVYHRAHSRDPVG
jgi:hypothetical protein